MSLPGKVRRREEMTSCRKQSRTSRQMWRRGEVYVSIRRVRWHLRYSQAHNCCTLKKPRPRARKSYLARPQGWHESERAAHHSLAAAGMPRRRYAPKPKGATGHSTWLVERRVVPELSALNQSLRRSTGTLNARVERSVLKGAGLSVPPLTPPPCALPLFFCDCSCALLWPWDCRKGPSTTVRP